MAEQQPLTYDEQRRRLQEHPTMAAPSASYAPRYDTDQPNDSVVADPPVAPALAPELLAAHGTDQLRRWHTDLVSHIPSDPSFIAAAGAVLRSLLSRELTHPDRVERDKAEAQARKDAADKLEADKKADEERAAQDAKDAKDAKDAEIERRQGHVPGPPRPRYDVPDDTLHQAREQAAGRGPPGFDPRRDAGPPIRSE